MVIEEESSSSNLPSDDSRASENGKTPKSAAAPSPSLENGRKRLSTGEDLERGHSGKKIVTRQKSGSDRNLLATKDKNNVDGDLQNTSMQKQHSDQAGSLIIPINREKIRKQVSGESYRSITTMSP